MLKLRCLLLLMSYVKWCLYFYDCNYKSALDNTTSMQTQNVWFKNVILELEEVGLSNLTYRKEEKNWLYYGMVRIVIRERVNFYDYR